MKREKATVDIDRAIEDISDMYAVKFDFKESLIESGEYDKLLDIYKAKGGEKIKDKLIDLLLGNVEM